jgi:hypothetical protein
MQIIIPQKAGLLFDGNQAAYKLALSVTFNAEGLALFRHFVSILRNG